ncbi:hypothetical protein ABK040_000825 [Willaertia magna]
MSSNTLTNNANNNTNHNNTIEQQQQQDTEHNNNNEITDNNNNENNNNEILTYKNAGKVLFQLLNLFFIKFPNIKELGLMLCKENPPKTILELNSLLNYFNNSLNLNNTLNLENLNLENINLENINLENINLENINLENLNLENINLENNLIEEPNRNVKTAFPFLYKDNRIGLSFWALPFIYEYAYHELLKNLKNNLNELNNLKNNLKNKENENENLNNLTRAILVISADCYSAWNVRKELLLSFKNCKDYNLNNFENNFEEKIKKEFELMDLVLSKHPKSCETWEHRTQFLIIFFPGHETLWVFRRFLWFFLLENYNLYENYFTIDSLQNCLMDLSEFAFELYKHSSLEIYPYEPVQLSNELYFIQRCINDKELINTKSQIHFALTNTLQVLKQIKLFINNQQHNEDNIITKVFISPNLSLINENDPSLNKCIDKCINNIQIGLNK